MRLLEVVGLVTCILVVCLTESTADQHNLDGVSKFNKKYKKACVFEGKRYKIGKHVKTFKEYCLELRCTVDEYSRKATLNFKKIKQCFCNLHADRGRDKNSSFHHNHSFYQNPLHLHNPSFLHDSFKIQKPSLFQDDSFNHGQFPFHIPSNPLESPMIQDSLRIHNPSKLHIPLKIHDSLKFHDSSFKYEGCIFNGMRYKWNTRVFKGDNCFEFWCGSSYDSSSFEDRVTEECVCDDDDYEWSYRENTRPGTWSSYFESCGGNRQSPINLNSRSFGDVYQNKKSQYNYGGKLTHYKRNNGKPNRNYINIPNSVNFHNNENGDHHHYNFEKRALHHYAIFELGVKDKTHPKQFHHHQFGHFNHGKIPAHHSAIFELGIKDYHKKHSKSFKKNPFGSRHNKYEYNPHNHFENNKFRKKNYHYQKIYPGNENYHQEISSEIFRNQNLEINNYNHQEFPPDRFRNSRIGIRNSNYVGIPSAYYTNNQRGFKNHFSENERHHSHPRNGGSGFIHYNYEKTPTSAFLTNNARSVQYTLEAAPEDVPYVGGDDLDGEYEFSQLHFHWGSDDTHGSEHTIDGQRFPMEIHLFHWKRIYGNLSNALEQPDGLLVYAYMFEISSRDNPAFDGLIGYLGDITEAGSEVPVDNPLPLEHYITTTTNSFYFRYLGSLTTPTCNENVLWAVSNDRIPISSAQIEKFRTTVRDEEGNFIVNNFRPLQPSNGRIPNIVSGR